MDEKGDEVSITHSIREAAFSDASLASNDLGGGVEILKQSIDRKTCII